MVDFAADPGGRGLRCVVELASENGSERLYTSPATDEDTTNENALDRTGRGRFENLEHETGLEPATPTLATWRSTN